MSAISKILAALGKIFGFFTGLFTKKKGEFYLEIDDAKKSETAASPAPKDTKTAPAKPEGVTGAAAFSDAVDQSVAESKASTAVAEPENNQTPITENEALNLPEVEVETIEPINIPKFGSARRPSANMKMFLDMAKTVKS